MATTQRNLVALQERATLAQRRAEEVRQHAAQARKQAGLDIALGDDESSRFHRREADAHERAAQVIEQTAALYRRRIRYLSRAYDQI